MLPYFVLFALILLLAFLGVQSHRNIFLKLIFVVFTLFAGFRYKVGVDYPNYVKIFQKEEGYLANEIGFQYILDFLRLIGGTYQLMFLCLAVIMNVLVYKIIKYYSSNVWISVLIYLCIAPFYFSTFNGTRQYVAIAVFLYSLRFLDKNMLKKYLLINLIGAIAFHYSLLFIAPLFPFIKKELSLRLKIILVLGVFLINSVVKLLVFYTPYAFYFKIEKEIEISAITYILMILLVPILLFEKKFNYFDHKTVLFNLIFFCFLTLVLVFLQGQGALVQMFMRINSYFFFSFIVFVPAFLNSFKRKDLLSLPYVILMLCLISYFFITIVYNGAYFDLVPYKTNFELLEY